MRTARVRRATSEDVATVSDVIAAAFYDHPVVSWVFPDDLTRTRRFHAWLQVYLERDWIRHGIVEIAGDDAAAAIWVTPGPAQLSADETAGVDAAAEEVVGEYAPRLATVIAIMAAVHPHEPHFYLFFLGTRPEYQGRSLGSLLLGRGLERSSERGVGAYLDATAPRNRALYERHGFRVTHEHHLPDGPTFWGMWRNPHEHRA
jgi:ribosomal protein S18 acetylase RimI-like enzyme